MRDAYHGMRNRASGDRGDAAGMLVFGVAVGTIGTLAIVATMLPIKSQIVRIGGCPEGTRPSMELVTSPAQLAIASCARKDGTNNVMPGSTELTKADLNDTTSYASGNFAIIAPDGQLISQSVNPDGTPGNVFLGVTRYIDLSPTQYAQAQPSNPIS
jgi:hypothetical protein